MSETSDLRHVAEELAKRCSNRTLQAIEIMHKSKPAGYAGFLKSLPCKIIGAGIHDKFVFWILDNDYSVWVAPSTTCSWEDASTNRTRVRIVLDDGEVCYDDPRGFSAGALEFICGRDATLRKLRSLDLEHK